MASGPCLSFVFIIISILQVTSLQNEPPLKKFTVKILEKAHNLKRAKQEDPGGFGGFGGFGGDDGGEASNEQQTPQISAVEAIRGQWTSLAGAFTPQLVSTVQRFGQTVDMALKTSNPDTPNIPTFIGKNINNLIFGDKNKSPSTSTFSPVPSYLAQPTRTKVIIAPIGSSLPLSAKVPASPSNLKPQVNTKPEVDSYNSQNYNKKLPSYPPYHWTPPSTRKPSVHNSFPFHKFLQNLNLTPKPVQSGPSVLNLISGGNTPPHASTPHKLFVELMPLLMKPLGQSEIQLENSLVLPQNLVPPAALFPSGSVKEATTPQVLIDFEEATKVSLVTDDWRAPFQPQIPTEKTPKPIHNVVTAETSTTEATTSTTSISPTTSTILTTTTKAPPKTTKSSHFRAPLSDRKQNPPQYNNSSKPRRKTTLTPTNPPTTSSSTPSILPEDDNEVDASLEIFIPDENPQKATNKPVFWMNKWYPNGVPPKEK